MSTSTAPQQVIVVGVDGSTSSQEALRWAAGQAQLTSASLRAVIGWSWPTMYGEGGLGYGYAMPADVDPEGDARTALAQIVTDVLGADLATRVEHRTGEGHPVTVLLEQANDASLLVVGSRGHGAFTGMLIGSVSLHCVGLAPCPVVVVKDNVVKDNAAGG